MSAEAAPTSDDIANRAYAAMRRPSKARVMFDRLLAAGPGRAQVWQALGLLDQRAATAYAARRLELREVYGAGAETMHHREERLTWLRRDEGNLKAADKIAWVKRYYARDGATLADFIDDWGYTYDPRLISGGKNPVVAFSLFPRQREAVHWMYKLWIDSAQGPQHGVMVKSRDVGASWVAMAFLSTLCIFRTGFAAGVGSHLHEQVDRSGDPDTLFFKARSFLQYLPPEFTAGFTEDQNSVDKRLMFPATGASITGLGGDRMGRGGRKAIFIVDEAAHIERPQLIDRNLSANTNCRIDMSSVNGMGNSFYEAAHNPANSRFDFNWRDDPRKNYPGSDWEARMRATLDEIAWLQEYECDWRATLAGSIIPHQWAVACIDIDKFLGIEITGSKRAALDIADRGNDLCAMAVLHGGKVMHVTQWSGKNSDTGYSVQRAMRIAEEYGLTSFDYDADGLGGAAVHSDARLINEARVEKQSSLKNPTPSEYFSQGRIQARPYRGSEAVKFPERIVPGTKRKAKDMFLNRKAQTWYAGRRAAYASWCARNGKPYDVEELLCIPGDLPLRDLLVSQLAQATSKETLSGKMQVDKNPDEVASPDLADAVLMALVSQRSAIDNAGARLTMLRGQQ